MSLIAQQRRLAHQAWAAMLADLAGPALTDALDAAGGAVADALGQGRQLLVAGNGGSAAMASHIAAEFVGKCIHDRVPLPAISLAESVAAVTAIANDYGYEHVFTRGVRAHGRPGDVLLVLTTSGSSPNVLAALDAARERGLVTIAMVGERGRRLAGRCDHLLVVPSDSTPRIQEVHLMWAHSWCEAVDLLHQPDPSDV